MNSFSTLKKNLKKDTAGMPVVKLALLGDSATQFLAQAIRGEGIAHGLDIQMWEADFNQVESEVFNTSSSLYAYDADVVVVFRSTQQLLARYNKSASTRNELAARELEIVKAMHDAVIASSHAQLVVYNFPELDDAVFGNYANKLSQSFLYQQRKLNLGLMELAMSLPALHICDLSTIQNQLGRAAMFDASIYVNTQMVLSIDVLPAVAQRTVALVGALRGRIHKCVVLDLDNTVWGGVIGDDGVENIQVGDLGIGKAFTEFQYWIRKLKERGVIVAVCSKNTASVAQEPFETHPDMILRMEDIAVFMANWDTKVDNIRAIQQVLNIGFDSMVFIDDNPFERDIVRRHIEGIAVPDMPEDPAEFLEHLYTLDLFETVSFSEEDTQRTRQYREEAGRAVFQKTFANEDAYLESLGMVSVVESFHSFNIPRVAQLSQRSNQFNLRTVRYTESDVERISKSEHSIGFAFSLKDTFGDHGLISVVILEPMNRDTLFINTWLMSCRVLKRGMESFVLNTLVATARAKGYTRLEGEYIPTPKNSLVKDHYMQLGFKPVADNRWALDLQQYEPRPTHIHQP